MKKLTVYAFILFAVGCSRKSDASDAAQSTTIVQNGGDAQGTAAPAVKADNGLLGETSAATELKSGDSGKSSSGTDVKPNQQGAAAEQFPQGIFLAPLAQGGYKAFEVTLEKNTVVVKTFFTVNPESDLDRDRTGPTVRVQRIIRSQPKSIILEYECVDSESKEKVTLQAYIQLLENGNLQYALSEDKRDSRCKIDYETEFVTYKPFVKTSK